MASRLLPDQVWETIRVLLPEHPLRLSGGRPPIGDREVLTGVLFVLKTGISWEDLPKEMGCGCGMTCLRRLRQWQQSGAWPKIQEILKLHLRNASRYQWARARGEAAAAANKPHRFMPIPPKRRFRDAPAPASEAPANRGETDPSGHSVDCVRHPLSYMASPTGSHESAGLG